MKVSNECTEVRLLVLPQDARNTLHQVSVVVLPVDLPNALVRFVYKTPGRELVGISLSSSPSLGVVRPISLGDLEGTVLHEWEVGAHDLLSDYQRYGDSRGSAEFPWSGTIVTHWEELRAAAKDPTRRHRASIQRAERGFRYALIARMYRGCQNNGTPYPTELLADCLGTTEGAVRTWVYKARKEGYFKALGRPR